MLNLILWNLATARGARPIIAAAGASLVLVAVTYTVARIASGR